jgi:hypothetical protein
MKEPRLMRIFTNNQLLINHKSIMFHTDSNTIGRSPLFFCFWDEFYLRVNLVCITLPPWETIFSPPPPAPPLSFCPLSTTAAWSSQHSGGGAPRGGGGGGGWGPGQGERGGVKGQASLGKWDLSIKLQTGLMSLSAFWSYT